MLPKERSLTKLPSEIKNSIKHLLKKSSIRLKELAMERWSDDGGAPRQNTAQKGTNK